MEEKRVPNEPRVAWSCVIYRENVSLKQRLFHKEMSSGTRVFCTTTREAKKFEDFQQAADYMEMHQLIDYKIQPL